MKFSSPSAAIGWGNGRGFIYALFISHGIGTGPHKFRYGPWHNQLGNVTSGRGRNGCVVGNPFPSRRPGNHTPWTATYSFRNILSTECTEYGDSDTISAI